MPLLIVPIWTSLKARKRSPGNAAFGGRKRKNATGAAARQPRCRRSLPLEFASKYDPRHSLLSPITGSLSAHLIPRQPVAQPSALPGGCQTVSPPKQLLQDPQAFKSAPYIRWNAELQPQAWKRRCWCRAPSLSRHFLLFSSISESQQTFKAQLKAAPPPGSLPRMLPSRICLGRLAPKLSLMPQPHRRSLSLRGIILWHVMISFQHIFYFI